MKNLLFIICLFFLLGFEQGFAQYKYKIEYDLTFNPIPYQSNFAFYREPYSNTGGNLDPNFLRVNYNAQTRVVKDVVVDYRAPIDFFRHMSYYGSSPFACYITDEDVPFISNCFDDFNAGTHCVYPNETVSTFFSTVVPLLPLNEINSFSSTTLSNCENTTIQVTSTNCEISYSVVANYRDIFNAQRTETIISYARRASSFTINQSLIPDLPNNTSFNLWVQYVESSPTADEISDPLIFSYVDCSPALTSGPTAINTKCSYSVDGSFTAQFERVLDASRTERMLVYLEKHDPGLGPITDDNSWENGDIGSHIIPDNLTMNGTQITWDSVLPAGTYRLRWLSKYGISNFDNPNSAKKSEAFSISAPDPISFTSSYVNETCPGSNDGTITFSNVQGGTPPYWYSIENGAEGSWQSSPTFSGLSSGNYILVVSDHNNNVETRCFSQNDVPELQRNITLTEPPSAPIIVHNSSAVSQPTVHGGSWSIDISSSGGVGSHTYQWTKEGVAGVYATTQDITGTGEGTYSVTAFDSRGCPSIPISFPITEPEPLGITFTEPVSISCFGGRGTIRAQGTGGMSSEDDSYTYIWTDNNSSAQLRSNLIAGIYEVTVRDKENNEITQTYELIEPSPIVVTDITSTHVLCKEDQTGSIALTIAGGSGSYDVTWTKSFDLGFIASGTTITGLTPGTYFYTITDVASSSCNVSNSIGIVITEPANALSVSEDTVAHVDNIVYGGTIGELLITISGGTEPYKSIEWSNLDDPTYTGSGISLTNLKAGRYQVIVTDDNDCTISLITPIIITEPQLLQITSATPTSVNCYGESTGSIKVNVSGGIEPYHYDWSKQGDVSFSAPDTDEIMDLSIGIYDVVVTDSSGSIASASTSVEITQNNEIAITLNNQQNNICYNDNQGSIDITVMGGAAPYTYQWSNGAISEDINTLQTGSYTVTVTDALGCIVTGSYEITQPADAVTISNIEVIQITAYGYNNGAINLTISGGAAPYTFDWFADNGFTSTSKDIANLAPGNYTVIVFDANYTASGSNACAAVHEFEIIEPDVLEVDISVESNLFCYGDTNGEIIAHVSGGVPPYSYTWYRVEGANTLLGANTVSISDIGTGSYQVIVTDANDIVATSDILNLSEPNELLLEIISVTNVLCHGESTGAIDMQITGGTAPYYINWAHGANVEDLQNIPAGAYTISVEDMNGCTTEQTINIINVSEALQITTSTINDVTSFDGIDGSLSIDFTGGASPYNVEWRRVSTGEIVGTTSSITNLTADDYRVMIVDANGCSITEIYTITEPDIVVASIVNPSCVDACNASISLMVNQGNGTYSYSWSNGSTSSTITNLCAGTYTVAISGYGSGNRILERTYEIINPDAFVIDLGKDKTLCEGQIYEIDASINDIGASYQWTSDNGFTNTNPSVDITESGTYHLTITNSLGCQATDSIIISRTQDLINSEFAISSQVFTGESVIVVNLSNPTPDSVEWILPLDGEIIQTNSDFTEMIFNTPGEYRFGMITRLDDCEAYQEKTIVVVDREELNEDGEEQVSERIPSIVEFKIYPNPSDGKFSVELDLKQIQNISLKVFRIANNSMVDFRVNHNKDKYMEYYDLSREASGMYFILLETPTATQIKKIIIK